MPQTKENRKNVINSRTVTTGNEFFKGIIAKVKKDLPEDWKERVLAKFPDLNNPDGFTVLQNIYYGRSSADAEVILYMADMATLNGKYNPFK
jgi:hypothetical protein